MKVGLKAYTGDFSMWWNSCKYDLALYFQCRIETGLSTLHNLAK
jgi:hypothetical protein